MAEYVTNDQLRCTEVTEKRKQDKTGNEVSEWTAKLKSESGVSMTIKTSDESQYKVGFWYNVQTKQTQADITEFDK